MKSTNSLSVVTSFKMKDKLAVHPNDGCDIGLFNHSYVKKFFLLNEDETVSSVSFECEITLMNECKNGTIEIGNSFWQRLGKPNKIKLSIDEEKIYIKINPDIRK